MRREKSFGALINQEKMLSLLDKRKGKLEAVTITGGEPLLQPDITSFITSLKNLGFKVKLDTNGSSPDLLEKLIDSGQLDYIAMDIKAPLDKYEYVIKRPIKTDRIRKSINLVKASGVDYEFRTTVVRPLLKKEDICEICRLIKGSRLYVLQNFVPSKDLENNPSSMSAIPEKELAWCQKEALEFVTKCIIR